MTNVWPMVPLGKILTKNEERIDLKPDETYKEVTVRLWGKGVTLRREVTGAAIASDKRIIVRVHQFILSRIDARNGAFGLIPDALDGAVVSTDFPAFSVNTSLIIPSYLEWMSKTADFVELCKAASEGTTNRVRLKEDRFLATVIPLPMLDEQRRIIARIEELAAKIEEARGLRRQAVEEAETLVNASARTMLSSVDVETTELRQWLDASRDGIQTGPFGAQLGSGDFTETGIPMLTIGNVQYVGLDHNGLKYVSQQKADQLGRFVVKEGDILFARMGTVGRCCVVPPEADGWLFNYHIIRVALDKARIEPRYVHWSMRASTDVEDYLSEKIRGATRQGVNSKIVGALPLRVPDVAEQRRIVAHLDELHARIDALKRLQAETQAELDALLPSVLDKAFKGEL